MITSSETQPQQQEGPERDRLVKMFAYEFVAFKHDPGRAYLVTDVTDDCMLELEGMPGLFAPHLFQRAHSGPQPTPGADGRYCSHHDDDPAHVKECYQPEHLTGETNTPTLCDQWLETLTDAELDNHSQRSLANEAWRRGELHARATADVLGIINGYIQECGQAAEGATGGDKLRLNYLKAAANEILRRVIAAPRATTEAELTVESALQELRELVRDKYINVCQDRSFYPADCKEGSETGTVFTIKIGYLQSEPRFISTKSLSDCMDQARTWSKSRAQKEVEGA